MGLLKPLVLTFTGVTVLYLAYPGNYKKFDRNILEPIRDYRANLQDYNRFQTEEEFRAFLSQLSTGILYTLSGK